MYIVHIASEFANVAKVGGLADVVQGERVSGKGELTRKRTVAGIDQATTADDDAELIHGRVIAVHGLKSHVLGDDGKTYHCAVRRSSSPL